MTSLEENVGQSSTSLTVSESGPNVSFASLLKGYSKGKVLNFRTLVTQAGNEADVAVPLESIHAVSESLVKLHGVHVTKFTEDGLSAIATNIRTPLMLDSFHVEYDWKPPRFACCKVFGHIQEECPKNLGLGAAKNLKKPGQASRGVPVGLKVGFKPTKEYKPVAKKPTANTSGIKKKDVESTKKNVETNTPIVDKIRKLEKLIIEGKVTLVDDDGKPLKINGFGTKSLLEQWTDSYENGDYDEDPYDDDIYEGHDLSDKLQDICDNLDIRVIAGDAKPSRQTLTPSSDSLKIFFFLSWKTKSTLPSSSNVVSKKADDVVIMIRIKKWKRGNKSLYEQWKENHGEDLYDDDDFDV
ncbi:hypothetical protein Tco_1282570 [Tanacetum coccineum]